MHQKTSQWKAYAALSLGLIAIGFSAIFVRSANVPGPVASFYRMFFGALIMAIPFARNLRKKPSLPRKGVLLAIAAGALFGADSAAWASGVMLSGATLPTLFVNTNPLWVGIGAWLIFKERLSAGFWIGLAIALTGITLILGVNLSSDIAINQGAYLGLLGAVFYGGYFLVAQRGRVHLDAISFFWIGTVSTAIFLLITSLILQHPLSGFPSSTWLNFLLQGLLIQAAGWLLLSYAQGYLPASLVSPTLLGQPVITAIAAAIILGESLRSIDMFGGLIVLLGIFVVHRSRNKSEISEAERIEV
jgi:drug/metabolite transporter (DMT)-like permease